MDNQSQPTVPPSPVNSTSPTGAAGPINPANPANLANPATSFSSGSVVSPSPVPTVPLTPPTKFHGSLVETIVLIATSLIAATFIGLFFWAFVQWNEAKTDVQGQVDEAVAIAVEENATALETEFAERERYPFNTFTGPADYGSLSFEYPRTWSVYIENDAVNGGDFTAYLNPGQVSPVSNTTINALRVSIRDRSFDNVARTYENYLNRGTLSLSVQTLNGGESANIYRGELPNALRGSVAIFRIRDKTAILQTDAEIFESDFQTILKSVTFNR